MTFVGREETGLPSDRRRASVSGVLRLRFHSLGRTDSQLPAMTRDPGVLQGENISDASVPTMDRPFASILILTSNDERYIEAVLDSLPAQTDPSREAVVVD